MELNYKPRNKAFSLLELIVAVAILSVGITVVLQAISSSAGATGLSNDIINAVFLAKDKIQELEFKEGQGSIEEGQVKDKKDRFEWGYTINLDSELNLYKLGFAINWKRANKEETLKLNSYLR